MSKRILPEGPPGPPMDLWLEEVTRLFPPQDVRDGVTVSDLAEKMGWPRHKALRAMNKLVGSGRWVLVGRLTRTRMDGQAFPAPAYAPVPQPEEEKP